MSTTIKSVSNSGADEQLETEFYVVDDRAAFAPEDYIQRRLRQIFHDMPIGASVIGPRRCYRVIEQED